MHLSSMVTMSMNINRSKYQQYVTEQEFDILKHCDHVHVCSDAYKEMFTDNFIEINFKDKLYHTKAPITVIPNGVDLQWAAEEGNEFNDNYTNVFFAGRFTDQKGIQTILDVIPKMPKHRFIFAGDVSVATKLGWMKYPIVARFLKMKKKYPNRVVQLGFVKPQSLMGRYAKQCDIWLAPSWHAPFELVGLEAMACGIPVILTNIEGFQMYGKHDYNCFMVEPRNPQQLKEAIERLTFDNRTRFKLIKNGFATARVFSWENTTNKLIELYEVILNERCTTPKIRQKERV